ncbi:hypothetical protein WOLCODRAFT_143370 [Wolfiporia cocos MD-104 SS10]|uniref:Uncharacterized protein n=1 Tax=Wolfiporia cocos (strain MD-104) TaxID=742152 RepID=A0A2H3JGN5_WOLCO|nr:hypothetical protein WOLCODRAFT_143370 [Wolfiporia cocos MD-104 SS10]
MAFNLKNLPPVAEDSASSLSSGSVVIIPWDRPPEIFERPAGMAPDPVLEACLQPYRDYYGGRLRYGPNGEPIYVTQHPGHPDVDVGMDTSSGSAMSREDLPGQTSIATAAVEGQEVIEFEATDGSQGTEVYAAYDALGLASGDLVTEPMAVDVNDMPI